MFERFTDRARRVVVLAQEEARMLDHNYIGTEHLLLGLVREGEGVGAQVLERQGITEEAVRQQVERIVGRGQPGPSGHLPFTPRAKTALELARREALQLGHNYIGTEHLLLGMIREGESPGVQVLIELGADLTRVRPQVIELLSGYQGEPEEAPARRPGRALRGKRDLLGQLADRLTAIESRLSALEHRVGTGPDTSDLDRDLAQLRRDKEAAIDGQDFETAAAMRDIEKHLLAEKAARERAWSAARGDRLSLTDEFERLQALLRQHGIEPQKPQEPQEREEPQHGAA